MSLNYTERIIFENLKSKGFDLIKLDSGGQPDFKVFNIKTNKFYYLEVKQQPITFTDLQKNKFKELSKKHQIQIAIVNRGKIEFKDYRTNKLISTDYYSKFQKKEPNMFCKKCKYEWFTTSTMILVSCPSCGTKNKTKGDKE